MWTPERRRCQFCKCEAFVYRNGVYTLVKYGIRHYAHPPCLATRRGLDGGKALIPEHQHASYLAAIVDSDATTIALAKHVDECNAKSKPLSTLGDS